MTAVFVKTLKHLHDYKKVILRGDSSQIKGNSRLLCGAKTISVSLQVVTIKPNAVINSAGISPFSIQEDKNFYTRNPR